MTTRERIQSYLEGHDMSALLLEPEMFDEANIGITECAGTDAEVVAYDRMKVIEILMREYGMDREEAEEYFSFNIAGAYAGEMTPVFIDTRWAE